MEKSAAVRTSQQPDGDARSPDEVEIGHRSKVRSRMASEIGAAMAHELNGPMTALLLYIGDLHQKRNRIIDQDGDNDALKLVIEHSFREAERICSLIHRMGDYFEAPIPAEGAIPAARAAIAWWARAGNPGGSRTGSVDRPVEDDSRCAAKMLTPREREVLRLVSAGFSNKEGAMQLNISYRTFECHRAEVMRKLGAKNTADLVRLALESIGSGAAPQPCGT